MAIELNAIDPALGMLGELAKVTRGTTGHLQRMRQEAIFSDGAIPAKVKALAAALWSISARCEPCLKFYILKAKELGATEWEIGEILAVAAVMGGCVGEMWALKAFQASATQNDEPHSSCCA
jgi:AhpD family alkylhydroperoxidase